jgi:hypothetical protein
MKKTLLALAVMTAAGAVSANEIMSNDIASASLTGSLEAKLLSAPNQGDNRKSTIGYGDAELNIDAEAMVYENLTAFGSFNLDADKGESTSIGFKGTWGTLEIGGVDHAFNGGNGNAYEYGGFDLTDGKFATGDNVVAYSYAADMFSFGLSYDMDTLLDEADESTRFSATASVTAGMFVIGADYTSSEKVTAATDASFKLNTTTGTIDPVAATDASTSEASVMGLEATGTFGDLVVGAGYQGVTLNDVDSMVLDYYGSYTMGKATLTLGGQTVTGDILEGQAIYGNVAYALTDIVSTNAEIASYSVDGESDGLGLAIGASIAF